MNQRILFLDHVGVLGGAELSLLDIAKRYAGNSKVLLFADGPFRHRLEESGVAVGVVSAPGAITRIKRGSMGFRHVIAIYAVIRLAYHVAAAARRFDAIFANSQKALVIGALASVIARKPLIWSLRDILTASHFSLLNRRIAVFLAKHFVSRIVANSEATRQAFYEAGGRGVEVSVVHNGIDPDPFEQTKEAELTKLRRELRLNGRPVVGVFSRLAPWKGQDVLIEAMVDLPGVHGLIVGDALFNGEDQYAAQLKARVGELHLTERVHFLGFRDDIPQLMQISDVIVHTSVAPEPFGRVMVEGMLAGKPIIACRAGGALEIVEHEETGLLVEPGNPAQLAIAIRSLLEDPQKAGLMGQKGRRRATRCFSVCAMTEAMEREIAAAINGGR